MPPSQSSSDSSASSAEPRPTLFEVVRRFSDRQLSTVLHNLIGLPSVVDPPNTNNWAAVDGAQPDQSRPHGASNSMNEVRKRSDGLGSDESNRRGGSAVIVPSGGNDGTAATSDFSSSHDRFLGELFEPLSFPVAPVVSVLGAVQQEMEAFAGLVKDAHTQRIDRTLRTVSQNAQVIENAADIDYYNFWNSVRDQSPPAPKLQQDAVSTYSEVWSVTNPEGVTRTRRLSVKRYADGTKVRAESDDTELPSLTLSSPPLTSSTSPSLCSCSHSCAPCSPQKSMGVQKAIAATHQEGQQDTPLQDAKTTPSRWFWSSGRE